MTNNGFAADFLQILLGWLQNLFNGVWALFSGGSGGSVLRWFSQNWLSLLVMLLIFGIVTDTVIYLIRWRPFWWWFRKKRMVIDDEVYDDYLEKTSRRTKDGKYVVPSTIVKRKKAAYDEEDDEEDDDVFDVRKKKSADPFEVSASKRRSTAPRRKSTR
ncbi:MAG: hypothetical protein IJB25_10585 [Clostridia bacterium]|nr:hypothetical protein [Clostridia bacterium]MBQ4158939.1 hypothetical protein [Clostridia bacterium]MBQ4620302.1 hypothetical protein [Clostridia bacterium]MBQ9856844.1 hypothetical protein [Clostridia bacterium]